MPSKSSSDFSVHKLRGFHLKRLNKRYNQVRTSFKVLNVSSPLLQPDFQATVRQESAAAAASVAVASGPIKYLRISSESQKGFKSTETSQNQALKCQNEKSLTNYSRNVQVKGPTDVSETTAKNSFRHFCTSSFRHLLHTNSRRENARLIGEDLLVSNIEKNSSSLKDVTIRKIKKYLEEKTVDKVISLPNSLTIEAIKYKCKILQLHNAKCGCSSPRLHIYLTTNHRCGDNCSTEAYPSIDSISTSSSSTEPVSKYIFTIMTGKSKARKFPKRKASKSQKAASVSPNNISVEGKSSITHIPVVNGRQSDEPESELLGEECESLPTIMNTLSGDVEYIVLDDNTFNLNTSSINNPSQDDASSRITNVLEEDSDIKPDIQNLEQTSSSTKESRNWEDILERCLSEVSYQTNKTKGTNQSQSNSKIKVEQVEGNAVKTTESSSLAEVCTNHSPSIKDIFGDVSIKDEPIDTVDANDMSVEDFSQEIKKLTDSDPKTGSNSKWQISQVTSLNAVAANKGLFAGLIKEESKVTEDSKVDAVVSDVAVKEEKITSDDAKGDDYSSDDSLGPLQIDEREQAPSENEVSNISVVQPATSLILPSVNIISPFKIKIFFGTPHRVQLEKPHEVFDTSNISTTSIVGTSNATQNGTVPDQRIKPIQDVIDEEDSETDSLQRLVVNESNIMPSLTCIYCEKVSSDIQSLAKHFEDHQKEGLIICYFCQKSFGDKTGMKRHMRTHTGEKPYLCKVCGKRFSLPGNFKKHRDIHEDIRTEPCEICGKTFRRKEHLKYHMRTHTGEKPYTCTECGTSFTARYSLQIHMNIHLGKKPYKCSYCSKAFSDKSTMRKHVRVHTGEKPFHCEKCGRSFGESGTLAAHMATHRSDRPFKCKQCPLCFKTTGGLRQHEKIHTGEKQYACKYCGVKFLQKYNMTMHERIHTGEKPYSCNHCSRSFRSRSCLAKHIVLHGGEEERRYECEHCNSRFYRKAHLRRHIDMHLGIKNYECDICSKKFCARGTLDNHVKTFHTQGARRFPCNWCGRVFKRQVYVNTHECIRDPVKVEKYKKEIRALASRLNNGSQSGPANDNSSDTEYSSIEIKSEPEEDSIDADEDDGLGEIGDIMGNADFDIQEDMVKQDPS